MKVLQIHFEDFGGGAAALDLELPIANALTLEALLGGHMKEQLAANGVMVDALKNAFAQSEEQPVVLIDVCNDEGRFYVAIKPVQRKVTSTPA